MTLKTEHRLIGRHSATIINDLYKGSSGILDYYSHLVGSCIHGILNEFLHHGCRSLHNLSRGDHIRYITW